MMAPISSPLQGGLGYALIGEIIGITTLSWIFIGMMMRKIKETPVESVPEEISVKPTVRVEETPEYLALLEKMEKIQAASIALAAPMTSALPNEEVEKLQKTIAYLENKLLEYEIVQEEISSLGELRSENERLKVEIQELKNQKSSSLGQAEALIEKQFSEFSSSEKPTQPEASQAQPAMPEDLKSLLTDIESLSADKPQKN